MLRGSTLNDKQQGGVRPSLSSLGSCQLQCCVAAHSSSSHSGRKQMNHSFHTAAAAAVLRSSSQKHQPPLMDCVRAQPMVTQHQQQQYTPSKGQLL